ncbi:ROK family protein [Streptomyces johnsoniae]|uniref:ROK family protein n=1 Tax=Streptomyces johnsoniae TaxID=3075532 RepID=A0ABU2S3L6_9ACTN|nr:ROK family protein [Streptomyces sp. DSM 41886]MDT0442409.1 ROK family protein [Streptomyces sp. DSM 41886]
MHGVVTDLRAEVVAEHAEPLGVRTPEGVAAQARDLMDRLARESESPVAAGFTMGGNSSGGDHTAEPALFDAPWLDWWQVPLKSVLDDAMGIPCVVRNDVFALAYGQHWFGLTRGLSDFAIVAVGPGIGYALCLNGRVLEIAEEDVVQFGHHILDPGGPMCPVGHRGCAASYLSTGAILSAAIKPSVKPGSFRRRLRHGAPGRLIDQLVDRAQAEGNRQPTDIAARLSRCRQALPEDAPTR